MSKYVDTTTKHGGTLGYTKRIWLESAVVASNIYNSNIHDKPTKLVNLSNPPPSQLLKLGTFLCNYNSFKN